MLIFGSIIVVFEHLFAFDMRIFARRKLRKECNLLEMSVG